MFDEDALVKELTFKAVRSSGSGGQHVNKVATKVEILFNLNDSAVFDDDQKQKLKKKLKNKLTKDGLLLLQCGETRSQYKNKALVTERFLELLKTALTIAKKRVPTKVPGAAVKKRLMVKQVQSEKKANRKKPDIDL